MSGTLSGTLSHDIVLVVPPFAQNVIFKRIVILLTITPAIRLITPERRGYPLPVAYKLTLRPKISRKDMSFLRTFCGVYQSPRL